MPQHGTTWGYNSGCRCRSCKNANNEKKRDDRLALTGGTFGIRVGGQWAAITQQFLHLDSMQNAVTWWKAYVKGGT